MQEEVVVHFESPVTSPYAPIRTGALGARGAQPRARPTIPTCSRLSDRKNVGKTRDFGSRSCDRVINTPPRTFAALVFSGHSTKGHHNLSAREQVEDYHQHVDRT